MCECGCTARNQHHFFSSFPLSSISSLFSSRNCSCCVSPSRVSLSLSLSLFLLVSFRLALRSALFYFALRTRTFSFASFMHRISEIHSTFTTQVNKSHQIDCIPATTLFLFSSSVSPLSITVTLSLLLSSICCAP